MAAANLAKALGGARRNAGGWWSCRCPVHDDQSPSLSLRDGDTALIIRCWAGCDPRDVLTELRRRGLIEGRARYCPPPADDDRRRDDDDAARERIEIARRIWAAARDARGTLVERYLAGRGLTPPPPAAASPRRRRRRCAGRRAAGTARHAVACRQWSPQSSISAAR
jgi:hypothetical protein